MTAADYALMGIDSQTILQCFTWGFGVVIGLFTAGYSVGAVIQAIRQL